MTKDDLAPLYDPRNKLNDLSSKEWTYALGSVLMTRYPARGAASMAHPLRKAHPSPKPPQLMVELLRFFTKKNGRVLDPFCGAGSSLIACALEERHGEGLDLAPTYAQLYHDVANYLQLPPLPYHIADACDPQSYARFGEQPFDFVIADPPYSSMLARQRTGHRYKKGNDAATPFSDDVADLGNMPVEQFFPALITALTNCMQVLRHHGHMAVFIKDLQPTATHHNMLHADVVNAMAAIPQLRFRGYRIWHDANINHFPFGYPHTFVANQTHQFILIFRKE
jgi:DNA modification methylase